MPLIVHPEYERLKSQLTNLIFEHDNLVNQICPSIERNYVMQFGFLEYTLYKKEYEVDKLKMKLRLIQKEINNQNEVNIEEIDKIIKVKFADFEKKLTQSMDELNEKMAERNSTVLLSEEDSKKLRKLYKQLIIKLHPDLNQSQTDFEKNLFLQATKAFKKGNLAGLETISLVMPNVENYPEDELEKIKSLIESFRQKIEDIKEDYPYNKKELLSDKQKTIEYVNLLNELIGLRNEEIQTLNDAIDELI